MTKIKIDGGISLNGMIQISSNKNAVLPVLCATLLTDEYCVLKNIPKSPDVIKILDAIKSLGGSYEWCNESTVKICCKNITSQKVSNVVADIQSAILFVGPLLARFGEANVPVAIGCKLGYRGPEDHIEYLSHLGVISSFSDGRIQFTVDRSQLQSQELVQPSLETTTKTIIFSESSVTPTENLLIFLSSVTKFNVEVQGIAHEPHVEFLATVLREMGMTIKGKGSVLTTKGCFGKMKGFEVDFINEPDYVDFYGTAIAVALTRGNCFLKCLPTFAIRHMVGFLEKTGIVCQIERDGVSILGKESSYCPVVGFSKANETIWKLNSRPWTGFPVDCLPSFIAWAAANTNPDTATTTCNWMYEEGFSYVEQLNSLGASIETFPTKIGMQKILINGIHSKSETFFNRWDGQEVVVDGVPVIEGARAILSVALARKGSTTIKDISPLLRRNPDFIKKFNQLGATITIID